MQARTTRRPLRAESVTHVSDMKRNLCVRNGPVPKWRARHDSNVRPPAATGPPGSFAKQGSLSAVEVGRPEISFLDSCCGQRSHTTMGGGIVRTAKCALQPSWMVLT